MGKAFVYLLQSLKTKTFYLGWTTDVHRRLDQHNAGKSYYTKTRGPWVLIAYEQYPSSQAAKDRERKLKKYPRMRMLFTKRALKTKRGSMMIIPTQSIFKKDEL